MYSCIGFDIRQWPRDSALSVEEAYWEQNSEVYAEVMQKFSLKENEYQLLSVPTQEQLLQVKNHLKKSQDCRLICIELFVQVVKAYDKRFGFNTSEIKLSLDDFKPLGFDVCDINGLFTLLYDERISVNLNGVGLISTSHVNEALQLAQVANIIVPEHAPAVVARLGVLHF